MSKAFRKFEKVWFLKSTIKNDNPNIIRIQGVAIRVPTNVNKKKFIIKIELVEIVGIVWCCVNLIHNRIKEKAY